MNQSYWPFIAISHNQVTLSRPGPQLRSNYLKDNEIASSFSNGHNNLIRPVVSKMQIFVFYKGKAKWKWKNPLLVMTELFLMKYFFNSVKTFAHTFPPTSLRVSSYYSKSNFSRASIYSYHPADADIKWQSRDVDTRSLRCIIMKTEPTTPNALRFKGDHDRQCCFSPLS